MQRRTDLRAALCTALRAAFFLVAVTAGASELPAFREIWGYLLRGEEGSLTGQEAVTDVAYFSARLTRDGRITETVKRPAVTTRGGAKPLVHLVVAELTNESLLHFALDPRFGIRPLLIADIARVSDGFDGVQVDFEAVARDDAGDFVDFLKQLRQALPAGRTLSVALPARTRLVSDAYDYTRIAPVVDRIIVMAYDEHWSGSAPGPVASLSWCVKVADYAASVIGPGTLVMGLPLYGRAWADKALARALRFSRVQDLINEKEAASSWSSELGASFEYSETVLVTVFFDDERSLGEKLSAYRDRGVGAVAFWRIGLGPDALWEGIMVVRPAVRPPVTARPAPPL